MARRFQVGDFSVEPDLNRITKGETVVSVEPKVLDVLVCLAERPGEVFTREQILRAVWPDTHVTGEALTYSISALRKALGDDARAPQIIQTIARRGYRLIARVQAADAPASPPLPSVAVLAFSDMSQEKDHEYFCDGIAEEITNRLTRLRGLRVAARTSAFAFKGQAEDVRAIGRKLGVGAVLEGSVRKAGTHLRITAQLINVDDGCHLWSASFDRESEDVFTIQDEISQEVVHALEVELSDRERSILGKAPTQSVEAYEFYLRGRQFFYKSKRKSIQCALEMLTRAAGKDPIFAQAWAGMADCYSYLYMYFDNDQLNLELAREMSRTSLELDPDLAEAHTACGLAASLSKQYGQAEREFQAAIRLNPHLFEAYYFYARTCFVQGKLEEATRLYEQAESVKPDDCQAPSLLAFTCRTLGQRERAEAAYRRTLAKVKKQLELNPDDSRAIYLGATSLMELGNHADGLEWARRSYSLDPDDPYIVYGIACFHSRLGMTEEAVDYFEQAVRAGFSHVDWIKNDSDFDQIRNHPRFQAALRHLEDRPARPGIGATFSDADS
jgi:TolB-like protein/Flp pilus assembly protein TadD